jgi:glucose-6-phosphate dehydrogenase assembly protein OpcA
LGRRELAECLADELHRLDPDEIYAETLTKGLARLAAPTTKTTTRKAAMKKTTPSAASPGSGTS